jgi:uncharacterized protein
MKRQQKVRSAARTRKQPRQGSGAATDGAAAHRPGREAGTRCWRELLQRCRVASLATASRAGPWSAPLFVAADGLWRLLFITAPTSRHGRELARDPRCSAALWIAPRRIAALRGAQLAGRATPVPTATMARARAAFLRRHPGAASRLANARDERLYELRVDSVKVTDNRLGFGWKVVLDAPTTKRS